MKRKSINTPIFPPQNLGGGNGGLDPGTGGQGGSGSGGSGSGGEGGSGGGSGGG